MEPREQKHQTLTKYSENTTPQEKWETIMRHDYMGSIYVRENGFDDIKYVPKKHKYIPDQSDSSCVTCGAVMRGGKCKLCDHLMFSFIVKEVDDAISKFAGKDLPYLTKKTTWSVKM